MEREALLQLVSVDVEPIARLPHPQYRRAAEEQAGCAEILEKYSPPLLVYALMGHLAALTPYLGKNGTHHYANLAKKLFEIRREFKIVLPAPATWARMEKAIQPVAPPSPTGAAFVASTETKEAS